MKQISPANLNEAIGKFIPAFNADTFECEIVKVVSVSATKYTYNVVSGPDGGNFKIIDGKKVYFKFSAKYDRLQAQKVCVFDSLEDALEFL